MRPGLLIHLFIKLPVMAPFHNCYFVYRDFVILKPRVISLIQTLIPNDQIYTRKVLRKCDVINRWNMMMSSQRFRVELSVCLRLIWMTTDNTGWLVAKSENKNYKWQMVMEEIVVERSFRDHNVLEYDFADNSRETRNEILIIVNKLAISMNILFLFYPILFYWTAVIKLKFYLPPLLKGCLLPWNREKTWIIKFFFEIF